MLPTNDRWFGMTYKEDVPFVIDGFKELIKAGVYKDNLYDDLNKVIV